jgi:hypothetical protein
MLYYLFPNFNWQYIPYASVLSFELRINHDCLKNKENAVNTCHRIRIKYNGQFMNLLKGDVFADSIVEEDGPFEIPSGNDPFFN